MTKKIKFKIDNREVEGVAQETIMTVANRNNIKILGLCYCPDLKPESSCRLCLVSIIGRKGFFASCNTKIEEGMEVITASEEIEKIRKINFELISANHLKDCSNCRRKRYCRLLKIGKDYEIKKINKDKKIVDCEKYQFGPAIVFDSGKCVNCYNCVQACNNQGVSFLNIEKLNGFSKIVPCSGGHKDCVYCGQCLSHCPSGAFSEVDSIYDVERILADKENYVVFQFSSIMLKSIQQELGPKWNISFLSRALKSLGGKMIFDTSFGVDIILEKESKELIERMNKENGSCLFTSHCPAWVKYIEFYSPEFIPSLSSNRSPHIIWGAYVKNYLTKERKINPKKIFVVSIAPCTSKKYEVLRPELKINDISPVDFILTTNEVCRLIEKNKNILKRIEKETLEDIFIKNVSAYNSNEGIVSSGVKLFYKNNTGKDLLESQFKKISDIENGSEISINMNGRQINVAIIYGLASAKKVLEKLKINPKAYDYVEVMACPKGCLGGGGQPICENMNDCDLKESVDIHYDNNFIQKITKMGEENIEEMCKTSYRVMKEKFN
ncbi:MAG: [Fe-Fe] hydrogenase large subunit C-terminal domain-containing protein [Candidatus Paceibacterota bacterium]|jgi:NADP-reducing hydrogenase subunit HndD|nr:2Fe-2S iron-sulfur cluster-binding protein [bacterium]